MYIDTLLTQNLSNSNLMNTTDQSILLNHYNKQTIYRPHTFPSNLNSPSFVRITDRSDEAYDAGGLSRQFLQTFIRYDER